MRSDHFIASLTTDLKPVRRRTVATDAMIVGAFCLADLAAFWWKLASVGIIAVVAGGVAVSSLDPVRSPRRGMQLLVLIVAICLATGWIIDAGQPERATMADRIHWREGVDCVCVIIAMAAPVVVILGLVARRGAPTDATGTASAVGLAGAAWGAFVFVFTCPYDDPLYVAFWYGVAFTIVTVGTRLLMPRLTRW